MKKKAKALLGCMLIIFVLSGCVPKLSLMEFRQTDFDFKMASHQIPAYVIEKKKARVAVLPPRDATPFRDKCNLFQSVQENFTQILAMTGTLELTERGQMEAFMQEMKFQAGITSEIDPQRFMQIAKNTDYTFVGSISSADAKASFTEGRHWTDKKGKTHYSPPSCSEKGTVLINYRLLSFPSGNIQKVFQMEGQKILSKGEVRYSDECKLDSPCGVLYEAISRAIDDAKESVIETFPVYGYIYKTVTHNSDPKKRIAFITLGKEDGLAPGAAVEIIEFVNEADPVKGTILTTPRVIAECSVVETDLLPDRSICVIPEENANVVFSKHAVRTKVKTGIFRKLQKIYRKVS